MLSLLSIRQPRPFFLSIATSIPLDLLAALSVSLSFLPPPLGYLFFCPYGFFPTFPPCVSIAAVAHLITENVITSFLYQSYLFRFLYGTHTLADPCLCPVLLPAAPPPVLMESIATHQNPLSHFRLALDVLLDVIFVSEEKCNPYLTTTLVYSFRLCLQPSWAPVHRVFSPSLCLSSSTDAGPLNNIWSRALERPRNTGLLKIAVAQQWTRSLKIREFELQIFWRLISYRSHCDCQDFPHRAHRAKFNRNFHDGCKSPSTERARPCYPSVRRPHPSPRGRQGRLRCSTSSGRHRFHQCPPHDH